MRMRGFSFALSGLVFAGLATLVGCGNDCGNGTVDNGDGACVPASLSCGTGTVLKNSQCTPNVTGCGTGTKLEGTVCIPDSAASNCGTGSTYDTGTGTCVGNAGITCGANTTLVNNVCTAEAGTGGANCGTGTVLVGTECQPDGNACGEGTALVDGVCRPGSYLQIVHNIPDAAAATVDVYVNGTLFADNLAFRNATRFTGVLSEGSVEVAVTASDAADASSPLASSTVTVALGEQVALIANGDGAGNFQVLRVSALRTGKPDAFDVAFVNGSADLGALRFFQGAYDLLSSGSNSDGIALNYGDYTASPLELAGVSFAFDALVGSAKTLLGTFQTSGPGFPVVTTRSVTQGHAAIVIASGLSTDAGLYAVLPAGGAFVKLDSGAHAQFVNLDNGDVRRDFFINDALQVGRFPLNAATAYLPIVAGTQLKITTYVAGNPQPNGVNPPEGGTPIVTSTPTLTAGSNYFFAIMPTTLVQASFDGHRSSASGQIDFAAFNAESATVDVHAFIGPTNLTLGDDLATATSSATYQSAPASNNTVFSVADGDGDNETDFINDLSTAGGRACVFVATGGRGDAGTERGLLILSDGEVRVLSPALF